MKSEESTVIRVTDPRHEAARKVLDAMHEYFDLDPSGGAVRWIEDDSGRVVIFTRGEYRDRIMGAIEWSYDTKRFEKRELELDGEENK